MKHDQKTPRRGRAKQTTAEHRAQVHRRADESAEHQGFVAQLRDFLARNTTAILLTALALLILQDVFGNHGVLAMFRSQRQAEDMRKQIDQLDVENRKLQDHVKSLKSDPAAIERIAREEMGLARPGEYIFKLPPKPGETTTPKP